MMVRLCLLRFVLWSCLTFLVTGEYLAQQRQHALETVLVRYGKTLAAPDGRILLLRTQYEVVGAVSAPPFSSKKIGGRKMVMQNVKENEMQKEEKSIGGDAPKSTGTIFFAGKCEKNQKDEFNAGCKLNGRNLLQMKFKRDRLAFTADYHVPKPHPPKNN